ncbi:ATP-binding cassette domain-containing protein [Rhodocytophaga rosea]|uniref:ATP-binding cassette domain-containing protein n=1 Tax=Rhodocytophaga rosea TaxID=2704465 RepID=A0A6C0GNC3_9BACT|nr:ATP-binding cassette domain-containing protein [Rhodocytophaga rosea]QHT69551.1 ATP-binding cassette domain-containing protein [Rhodocytophaga rosea]
MIEVRQVSRQFGNRPVVSDISFTVKEKETLVLLGSSGSGKTTTLKMLNRLIEPDSGEILIGGKNVLHQPLEQLRRSIGYVIQQTGLFPHYTVAENIAIVPHLLKWSKEAIKQRVKHLLETLGLPPAQFAARYPHELSGGQQQRVGLARALAANPPILLMDEPFGALDPVIRHNIRQEFLNLEELKDKTIVMVTHDVTEAVLLANQICLLSEGKILQTGTARELLLQPVNTLGKEFFDQNRFQLERMVYTLADIFPRLTFTPTPDTHVPVFDSELTLWEILNKDQYDKTGIIGIRQQSQLYYVPVTQLLSFMPEADLLNSRK